MNQMTKDSYASLYDVIGYTFKNSLHLQEALTHSSRLVKEVSRKQGALKSNERLEFLGDRVLGMIIAEWLYKRYECEEEGDLSRRLAFLVSRETLAKIANSIDLTRYISKARIERFTGGAEKKSLASNACEALIAALYLDGGYGAAQHFVYRFWQSHLDSMEEAPKDDKSALQEWAQAKNLGIPTYTLIDQKGPDHAPSFVVHVVVAGYAPAEGRGSSKRKAEQDAAHHFIQLQKEKHTW